MDSSPHAWEIIITLATALQSVTLGALRYLVKQVDRRDSTIELSNKALAESARANAEVAAMVPTLVDQITDLKHELRSRRHTEG